MSEKIATSCFACPFCHNETVGMCDFLNREIHGAEWFDDFPTFCPLPITIRKKKK